MAACTLAAQAKAEFCPAMMWYRPAIPATSDGRSSGLVFGLFAHSPRRIVSARIIADTDAGWYTWDVSGVDLTLRTTGDGESTRSVATFDKPVFVRHAWVSEAQATGDAVYGWDADGTVACDIPAFGHLSTPPMTAQVAEGFPHVTATPIPQPYTTDCPHPFAEATVVRPARPVWPLFVPRARYVSQIEVVVGDHDNVLDAMVYQTSGENAIDASAMAAARASSYSSGVSYCKKAVGDYLFRADFAPR